MNLVGDRLARLVLPSPPLRRERMGRSLEPQTFAKEDRDARQRRRQGHQARRHKVAASFAYSPTQGHLLTRSLCEATVDLLHNLADLTLTELERGRGSGRLQSPLEPFSDAVKVRKILLVFPLMSLSVSVVATTSLPAIWPRFSALTLPLRRTSKEPLTSTPSSSSEVLAST